MTLRHIRIFEAVCDCGCNMTRAAEALHMTQPAVSLAVSELESYYGVMLFDRIARRLRLTEAGRSFLDYARRISLSFDDMERTVRNWEKRGVLRVGASVSIGAMLMPSYVAAFKRSGRTPRCASGSTVRTGWKPPSGKTRWISPSSKGSRTIRTSSSRSLWRTGWL